MGLLKMHIRSLAAGFTFRAAEYTGSPVTAEHKQPDFETYSVKS